jgi:hypothetical protein
MEIDLAAYPTTVTALDGKFHPAISRGSLVTPIFYWDNITCATEEEAYERASLALKDAYEAANAISRQWHMLKL